MKIKSQTLSVHHNIEKPRGNDSAKEGILKTACGVDSKQDRIRTKKAVSFYESKSTAYGQTMYHSFTSQADPQSPGFVPLGLMNTRENFLFSSEYQKEQNGNSNLVKAVVQSGLDDPNDSATAELTSNTPLYHLMKDPGRQSHPSISAGRQQNELRNANQNISCKSQSDVTLLVGDSMLRNVKPEKFFKFKHVVVKTVPEMRVNNISDYVTGFVREENPSSVILHVGTNDLHEGTLYIARHIESVGKLITETFPRVTKFTISSIIQRRDYIAGPDCAKVSEVNKTLKNIQLKQGWDYIDNENLDPEVHLGQDGIHLNVSGTRAFAANIGKYLELVECGLQHEASNATYLNDQPPVHVTANDTGNSAISCRPTENNGGVIISSTKNAADKKPITLLPGDSLSHPYVYNDNKYPMFHNRPFDVELKGSSAKMSEENVTRYLLPQHITNTRSSDFQVSITQQGSSRSGQKSSSKLDTAEVSRHTNQQVFMKDQLVVFPEPSSEDTFHTAALLSKVCSEASISGKRYVESEKVTLLIGDSLLESVNSLELSRTKNTKLVVVPDARVDTIGETISKHARNSDVDEVILHIGSKDLKDDVYTHRDIATKIEAIGLTLETTCPHIAMFTISGVTETFDYKRVNSRNLNHLLRSYTLDHCWAYISNDNIHPEFHMERFQTKLNSSGTGLLTSNIIRHLRYVKSEGCRSVSQAPGMQGDNEQRSFKETKPEHSRELVVHGKAKTIPLKDPQEDRGPPKYKKTDKLPQKDPSLKESCDDGLGTNAGMENEPRDGETCCSARGRRQYEACDETHFNPSRRKKLKRRKKNRENPSLQFFSPRMRSDESRERLNSKSWPHRENRDGNPPRHNYNVPIYNYGLGSNAGIENEPRDGETSYSARGHGQSETCDETHFKPSRRKKLKRRKKNREHLSRNPRVSPRIRIDKARERGTSRSWPHRENRDGNHPRRHCSARYSRSATHGPTRVHPHPTRFHGYSGYYNSGWS